MKKRIPRRRRRQSQIYGFDFQKKSLPSLVRLWLLRLLVPLGTAQRVLDPLDLDPLIFGGATERVFIAAGLDQKTELSGMDDQVMEYEQKKKVLLHLRELHFEAEKKSRRATLPIVFRRNMEVITKLVGLSESERRVLEFTVFLHEVEPLRQAAQWLQDLSSGNTCQVLSKILRMPYSRIKNVLMKHGPLQDSGLLELSTGQEELHSKLELLDSFADRVMLRGMGPETLLKGMVTLGEAPELSIKNYAHLGRDLTMLRAYLKRASMAKRRGVNILLYGPPGTGKTQLARVLAAEIGRELFEVASSDSNQDGELMKCDGRLRAYNIAQCFFAKRRALILFDEAEDVFGRELKLSFLLSLPDKGTSKGKGGVNKMLEKNRLPAIWISNSVGRLDPAYSRRFDMVMELPVPPKSVREDIMRNACGQFIDARTVNCIAESKALAPAVVTRASSVVKLIRRDLKTNEVAPAFEALINNVLKVQGHSPIKRNDPNRLPEIYDPAFINADRDTTAIADALVKVKQGRLCLYGAPGTGKTAYARWIADRMGAPLLVKRASDLLSMWVGAAEKNIAAAFKEAEQDSAVLVIDEVDGLLRDRRGAMHSWQVTEVNEMLTQIESFGGVFIASTNLMDSLDQAVLRRFDFKIKFDFLRTEQAWELLRKHCAALKLPAPDKAMKSCIARITNLAPGDFAAVVRQSMLHSVTHARDLVTALESECALKENTKQQTIGFR